MSHNKSIQCCNRQFVHSFGSLKLFLFDISTCITIYNSYLYHSLAGPPPMNTVRYPLAGLSRCLFGNPSL